MFTSFKDVHSENAQSSIEDTEDGIDICFNDEHPLNTPLLIVLIEDWNNKSDNEEHSDNA